MSIQQENFKLLSYYDIKLHELVQARNIDIKKFKPKIIEVTKEALIFGMIKHFGRLSLPIEKVFNPN